MCPFCARSSHTSATSVSSATCTSWIERRGTLHSNLRALDIQTSTTRYGAASPPPAGD
jgi:hypothetical protein